jgi:hypothetical protein
MCNDLVELDLNIHHSHSTLQDHCVHKPAPMLPIGCYHKFSLTFFKDHCYVRNFFVTADMICHE